MKSSVPDSRVRLVVDSPPAPGAGCVLYWMTAFRRTRHNFALQRAAEWSRHLGRPLLVLEALGCGHPWASPRFHRFVIHGMRDNGKRLERAGIACYPYVEPRRGEGRGLLETLAKSACVVVADDAPVFHLPRLLEAGARKVRVRMEAVDSNGLIPLDSSDKDFPSAFVFRRFAQRNLPDHLSRPPAADPLRGLASTGRFQVPASVRRRWPAVDSALLDGEGGALEGIPLDRDVEAADLEGGERAAASRLARFVEERMADYAERRNDLAVDAGSGLSPYLHFGHVSTHQILAAVAATEGWSPGKVGRRATGKREGWWGMSRGAEAFLDQCVIWRELGYHTSRRREDFAEYESLPAWALGTLEEHARDRRRPVYTLRQFEQAGTHDPLWNAAQTQLAREGTMHNYVRMLWGKKILEWSESPREAFDIMVELNNRYALDGRDPNSYSGIAWCLGRYDRPWGPERPIFGRIRYMSSDSTARKFRVEQYVRTYAPERCP